jgi:hypothetical protein
VLQLPQYMSRGRHCALAVRSVTAATRLLMLTSIAAAFGSMPKMRPSATMSVYMVSIEIGGRGPIRMQLSKRT